MSSIVLAGSPPPLPSNDKTEIVKGLREVARGIEQGTADPYALMQAIGTELLVLALKNGPNRANLAPDVMEGLLRREIAALVDSVVRLHEAKITERAILEERLFRMFDPSLAFNEAINRAIERKKEARDEIDPHLLTRSPQQDFMWKNFQLPTLEKALKNA